MKLKIWLYAVSTSVVLGLGGACVPDNLWADIWGYSIIQGVIEGLRNTALVGAGLQTP